MKLKLKFWTTKNERRIRELQVKLERQQKLLRAAHAVIHHGMPHHGPEARDLRDRITRELQ